MATSLTNTTFPVTYKDDFIDSDNYHRILFNSGKALQARELTQLQTIIQEEISRFGSNIFIDGAVVNGSGFTVDNKYEYIKLADNQLPSATGVELLGTTFIDPTGIKFKILEVVLKATTGDKDTLYIKYLDTRAGTAGATPVRVGTSGVTIQQFGSGSLSPMTVHADAAAVGTGTRVSIGAGSFFVQGHFVFAKAQTIIASFYDFKPNATIGFKVDEDIVTTADDNALFDNQGAVPNAAAPGADRYRIKLTLINKTSILPGENFVYLFKLTNGKITDEARVDNSYNELSNTLALRTKEESGNYIVKDFTANFDVDSSNTGPNLVLKVSDGIAYVDGYRVDADAKSFKIPKSTTTTNVTGEVIRASYGNYIDVQGANNKGLPNINSFARLHLAKETNLNTPGMGTARVRALYEQGTNTYRAYLFDIQMEPGRNFENVKSIGHDSNDYMNFVLEGGRAILKNTSENNLLFPLPRSRPNTITHGAIQTQRRYTFTTGGGVTSVTGETGTVPGPGAGAGPGAGYVYTAPSQWVLSDSQGLIVNVTPTISGGGSTFDYTGLTQNKSYEVLAQVTKASPGARSKTLQETTKTISWPADADSDGTGKLFFNLGKADVYDITRLRQKDSDGLDLSQNFILDNGQRDNFYDIGRLFLRGGSQIKSATSIFARFRYFSHGAGEFFDVSSYPAATVPYNKIPTHTLADGSKVSLRDVIDFRPVAVNSKPRVHKRINMYASFDSSGVGTQPIVNFLPENGSTMVASSVSYYQSRKDRLVATTRTVGGLRLPVGGIGIVRGTPDIDPKLPPVPEGTMPIYDLTLNPNTLNDSDTEAKIRPAKGYTMADIGLLEDRIDTLTDLTTLSLLEADTSSLSVLDSSGLTRTKAGFLVDNFSDFTFSAIDKDEYNAVIDDVEGVLTPITLGKNTRLYADSGASTSISFLGDAAYLNIDSNPVVVDQNLATEAMNVNPFAVIISRGHTELSPETDEWVETKYLPNQISNQGSLGTISRGRARALANRNFSAAGFANTWFGRGSGGSVSIRGRVGTIRRVIADRVIDISVIPFMRSRIVFFRSQGLRPNATHFLTFAGQDMSNFVRQETQFRRISGRNDNARTYTNRTSHPDGATALTSDSSGKIIGSFLIPSTPSLKIRTGTQVAQIMDVTGGNITGSTSNSTAFFASSGNLETRRRTVGVTTFRIEPPPPPPPPDDNDDDGPGAGNPGDPLAQSFYIDPVSHPNGYFLTEVDTFFRTKDVDGTPVQMQIRRVENGFPVDRPLSGAVKFVSSDSVAIPSDLSNLATVQSTPTTFKFDEPVYLAPARNYSVVLLAETTAYTAYVAKTYDFVLGSTEQRIQKQPTLGTLFLSQSGITWTPDQTRDLMFRLKRAQFASSGTLKLKNRQPGQMVLGTDPIQSDSGETKYKIFTENHGFIVGDEVNISGLDSATKYASVNGSTIMGKRTVTRVDHTGFVIDPGGSAAVGSLRFGGDGVVIDGQAMYDQFVPQIQTLVPDDTTISATIITASGASYGDKRTISGSANGSKVLQPVKPITLNEFNFLDQPSCIFNPTNEASTDNDFPDVSVKLDIALTTSDNQVSPVIDLQRNSLTTFETMIDTQDSADFTTGVNVPLARIRESDPGAGTSAAKHITVPVTLEEPAVGLKILFAANRPSASKFRVWFKTATGDEVLDELPYSEIAESTSNPSDEDKSVFREYEYLPGGIGGRLPAFTKFQVKIVMVGTNTAKSPTIKDLRIVALVT